jgi:hypothetical protein
MIILMSEMLCYDPLFLIKRDDDKIRDLNIINDNLPLFLTYCKPVFTELAIDSLVNEQDIWDLKMYFMRFQFELKFKPPR